MTDDERDKFLNTIRMMGDRPMYYGRKGEPLTLQQWSDAMEDMTYRRVGYDEVPQTHMNSSSYVSTVWLGLDHSFFLQGPPIIFETMRFELEASQEAHLIPGKYHRALKFPDPEPPHEYTEQTRYCTEEQASIGHKTIMRLIQETEMT